MTLQDYIAELQNPNNQTANYLRSNMNAATASGSQNLMNIGANQGWGGRSGMMGKLQEENQNAGNQALMTGLNQADQSRMSMLGNAVSMAEQLALERQRIEEQKKARLMQMMTSIFSGIGGGLGTIFGGPLASLLNKSQSTPTGTTYEPQFGQA